MFQDFLRKNSFLTFMCTFQDVRQKFLLWKFQFSLAHFWFHFLVFLYLFLYIFQSINLLIIIKLCFFHPVKTRAVQEIKRYPHWSRLNTCKSANQVDVHHLADLWTKVYRWTGQLNWCATSASGRIWKWLAPRFCWKMPV